MGNIIQENEIENLKMKVIGLKNEIPQEMWDEFCEWLNSEVGYIDEDEEFINKNLQETIKDLEAEIEDLRNKLSKIKFIIEE